MTIDECSNLYFAVAELLLTLADESFVVVPDSLHAPLVILVNKCPCAPSLSGLHVSAVNAVVKF